MTGIIVRDKERRIVSRQQGPRGAQGVFPYPGWDVGEVPYPTHAVVSHSNKVWLALRANSVEPSLSTPDDWVVWFEFTGAVLFSEEQTLSGAEQLQARDNIAAQAASPILTALAALTLAAGSMVYATGAAALAVTPSTTYGRSVLNVADAPAGRTLLGLGTAAVEAESYFARSARNISTTGLLTGGGDLFADRIFDVAVASQAQAEAGLLDTVAMTPLKVQQKVTLDVNAAIAALIASSPGTLDTLNEIAAALGNDPNFAATITTSLGNRLRFDAAQSLSAGQKTQGQTNLGVLVGTDVQAQNANLASLAGLTLSADRLAYATGAGTFALTELSAFGRSLIDDAAAVNARTTLGLVIGTDVQAQNANLAALAGLTGAADRVPYFTGAGAMALYTYGQLKTALAIDAGDVSGLGYFATGTDAANLTGTINNARLSGVALTANNLSDLANAATARTNLALGNVDNTSDANKPVSIATQTALDLKVNLSLVAAVNGIASLDSAGKIPSAQLPAIAVTDTFVVASQAAMLALTAERGDLAIRSDLNKSFVLSTDSPSTLADWKELLTPTDQVLSVAGLTGEITAAGLKTALAIASTDVSGLGFFATGTDAANLTGTLSYSRLSGALPAANFPALTGDVTSTAGSLATTLATAQPAVHTWALAQTFTVAPVFTDAASTRTALGLAAIAASGSASDLSTGTLNNARLLAVPNSALANSSLTIAGQLVSLGGSQALAVADITGAAPLASPALTGSPTSPTPTANDNSTKIATTAYLDRLLAANSGIATLDSAGKIPNAQLPAIAITDSYVVASQAAMLALTAERGDLAIRSDLNKSFVLSTDSPGTLADWKELLTPTGAVISVAGLTGAITAAGLKTALAIASSDVSGLGYFATGTDAANLTGTVAAARLPAFTGGDVTSSAGSASLAIGAAKVTSAMLNADVYSTAHSWAGQQTLTNPIMTTPALGVATCTSLAINGATIGSEKLAVTGNFRVSGTFGVGGAVTASALMNLGALGGITNAYGCTDASGTFTLAGAATEIMAYRAYTTIATAANNLTNWYGFNSYLASLTGGGTLTNAYSFFANTPSAGTNKYNYYASGTAANVFEGALSLTVNVASTSPTTGTLKCTGGGGFTGAIFAGGIINGALGATITGAGIQVGAPTGGDKGAGTINSASGIYDNGVRLYSNVPQNSNSAAYTVVLADAGKHIFHPAADTTARIFTIDSNANVAFPVGTVLVFVNQNAGGVITIAITSDTLRLAGAGTTGSRSLAANGMATALKVTSTEWIIAGTGLT